MGSWYRIKNYDIFLQSIGQTNFPTTGTNESITTNNKNFYAGLPSNFYKNYRSSSLYSGSASPQYLNTDLTSGSVTYRNNVNYYRKYTLTYYKDDTYSNLCIYLRIIFAYIVLLL